MTDERMHDTPRRGELPAEVERDLAQWRDVTARDVPELRTAMARARLTRDAASPWRTLMNRPFFVPALVTAVVAIALLVVPVSYERTTGDRVTLTLASAKDPAAIAQEMKTALHASTVSVRSTDGALSFVADVPRASRVNAQAVSLALASALKSRGYDATVATAPIREKVTGNVYAFARDVVVKVDIADKSAAQIEDEIRSQLSAAGIPDAQVSVSTGEGDRKQVTMELPRTLAPVGTAPAKVQVDLTKNGEALARKGHTLNMQVTQAPDGGRTIHLTVGSDGQSQTFDIEHTETMTDAQLSEAIAEKLQAAGMNVALKVENGRITVERK
jgi:hypothetical protein